MEMTPQAMCVSYILLFLSAVLVALVISGKRGYFHFGTVQWFHVAEDIRHLGTAKLAAMRLMMAAYAIFTTALMSLPTTIKTEKGSLVKGPWVLGTFTIWCWSLIGVYFLLTGLASLTATLGVQPQGAWTRVFCGTIWVFFQIMFSCAFLVFVVVWFVLIPAAYATTGSSGGMLGWLPLSAHNLNVVFMTTEMVVNRLSFVRAHAVFMMLYGAAYVIFSWFFFLGTGVFFYFFVDWRHPATLIWYTGLIGLVYAAFELGRAVATRAKAHAAEHLPGAPAVRDYPMAEETGEVLGHQVPSIDGVKTGPASTARA